MFRVTRPYPAFENTIFPKNMCAHYQRQNIVLAVVSSSMTRRTHTHRHTHTCSNIILFLLRVFPVCACSLQVPPEQVAKVTTSNANEFFGPK